MEKTKKMMIGITATALALGLAGCSSTESSLPPKPTDENCDDWEYSEEDGVWRCDDSRSHHYRSYYYGGRYYNKKKDLQKNQEYANYIKNYNEGKTSSGFGSGKKFFGG